MISKVLKFFILIGLLLSVSVYMVVHQEWFVGISQHISISTLIAGLLIQPIIIIGLIMQSIRHKILINFPVITVGVSFRAMVLSQGLNLLLPARLSELLKATYLRDNANVPLSTGFSAVVLERTVDMLIVAILGVIGTLLYFERGNFSSIAIFGLVFALIVFVLVRSPRLIIRIVQVLPSIRVVSFLEKTYLHFSETAKTKSFWIALLLGGLAWSLSYINIWMFFEYAGSISIGFSGALLLFLMTTLGGAIPALPGGVATYEAAAVIALSSLGYSFEEALVLAIALHSAQLILPFVMAVIIVFTERIGLTSLAAELRKHVTASKDVK